MRTLTAERVAYARLSVNELFAMLPNFGGMVFLFAQFSHDGGYLKLEFLICDGYRLQVWLPTIYSGQPVVSLVRYGMGVEDIFCPNLNGVTYCMQCVIKVTQNWHEKLLLKTMEDCWLAMRGRRTW